MCLHVGTLDFLHDLKRCVDRGGDALIDDVGNHPDPAIDPLLVREFLRTTGGTQMVLASEAVPVRSDFCLFVATKYPNQRFSARCARCSPSSTSRRRPRG
jgi:hypothetical protein